MRHIGFKNFRKFINFPDMEFGDITILVGRTTLVNPLLRKR